MEWNDFWSKKEDQFIENVKNEFKKFEKEISEFVSKYDLNEYNWGDYGYRYLFSDLKGDCGENINDLMDDIIYNFESEFVSKNDLNKDNWDDKYQELLDDGCYGDMEDTCMYEWIYLHEKYEK